MTVTFTVMEKERKNLAYILDSDMTHDEQQEQLLFLLHEMVQTLTNCK